MWVESLGLEDCLGGEHGNPLQYSFLENPMEIYVWWATVHRMAKSWTQLKQLSPHAVKILPLGQQLSTPLPLDSG